MATPIDVLASNTNFREISLPWSFTATGETVVQRKPNQLPDDPFFYTTLKDNLIMAVTIFPPYLKTTQLIDRIFKVSGFGR